MVLEDCINFILTNAQNTVFLRFRDKLAQHGVTPAQYAVLKCLWDHGEQSPSQLAQTLNLDASTITGILGRMELKDLIKRKHSRKDRRAIIIELRPLGKKLQAPIENTIHETNREVLSLLSDHEYSQLRDYLNRIVETSNNFKDSDVLA